jgi:hypothetical protein
MNKQTLILVLALGLLLIPTGVAIQAAFTVDKYKILEGEGGTAYSIAWLTLDEGRGKPLTPVPTPVPEPTKPSECKCNGTGFILSGDGLQKIKCQCGDDCKCKKSPRGEIPIKNHIIFLTRTKTCLPCQQMEKFTFPALKSVGWTFGKTGNIETIDVDDNPDSGYTTDTVPCLIVLDSSGKEIKRYIGFVNAGAFTRVYKGEDLLPSDLFYMEYKIEKKKAKSVRWTPFRLTPLKGEISRLVISSKGKY